MNGEHVMYFATEQPRLKALIELSLLERVRKDGAELCAVSLSQPVVSASALIAAGGINVSLQFVSKRCPPL